MKPKNRIQSRLALAFFLNLGFAILELIGGFFTNSIAIISDSIHDFGDSVSIGLSWILEDKAKKKPDRIYTYGYARYSLLGGLISSLVLLVGSTIVIVEAIQRLLHPESVDATAMIVFSIVGIAVNGLAAWHAGKGKSLGEKSVSLHLFEDVFGWIAILIGSILMKIFTLPFVDSILSIGLTLYILVEVFKNLREIISVFLEKAPSNVNPEAVIANLRTIEGVRDIHHVHLWSLEGRFHLITFHALLQKGIGKVGFSEIQKTMHERLTLLGLPHATIEFELEEDICSASSAEACFEQEEAKK